MRKLATILFLSVFLAPTINAEANGTPPTTTFKFVLTHLNGRELERNAYFYCGDTNPFKLDLRDGKAPFKYYISGGLGAMCGLYGEDQYGKSVSICITKLSGDKTEVEIKYTNKTMRFTGYFSR